MFQLKNLFMLLLCYWIIKMFYFQNENLPSERSVKIDIGLMWLLSVGLTIAIFFSFYKFEHILIGYEYISLLTILLSLIATILFQCIYKHSASSESGKDLQKCVSHSVLVVSYPSLISSILYLVLMLGGDYIGLY